MLPVAGDIESIVWSLIAGGGGGAGIKSIQRGTTEFTNSPETTVVDVAISPVNVTKSFAVISFHTGSLGAGETSPRPHLFAASLPSPDTLRIERSRGTTRNYVSWTVVEFTGNISVQQITTTTKRGTVTISPVDMSRAFLLFSYKTTNGTANWYQDMMRVYLADSDKIGLDNWLSPESTITTTVFVVEVK